MPRTHTAHPDRGVAPSTQLARLASLDELRGFVMALMALDHVRDYFSNAHFSPTDLTRTTPGLFFTRLVTHLCAPTFVLLAGISAFLAGRRMTPAALSLQLALRGAWLVVLEVTLVRFFWFFDLTYQLSVLQVLWALGMSMIGLALLVRLPRPVIALVGALLVLGHDALDGVHFEGAWWALLHEPRRLALGGDRTLIVGYPLVPWVGVMALGYAAGPIFLRPRAEARRAVLGASAAMLAAFVVLRGWNHYVDPAPWSAQRSPLWTFLSFLDVSKYPPSLAFLLLTLGAAGLVYGALDREGREPVLAVFGRVPLFFYVLHILVIHAAAVVAASLTMGRLVPSVFVSPPGYGFGLPVVYGVWLALLFVLTRPCLAFDAFKREKRRWWTPYV